MNWTLQILPEQSLHLPLKVMFTEAQIDYSTGGGEHLFGKVQMYY